MTLLGREGQRSTGKVLKGSGRNRKKVVFNTNNRGDITGEIRSLRKGLGKRGAI